MRLYFILAIVFILGQVHSQSHYKYFDSVPVFKNGDTLQMPFAGGLNNPQFSAIDLNRDGKQDILVFDRSLQLFKTFINRGGFNEIKYGYDPSFIKQFPVDIHDFAFLRDYNCDGEFDLFSQSSGGIRLHRNDYALNNDLSFTQVTPNYIVSDYGFPFLVNIWNAVSDIPGIEDVDLDGDLDILTFPLSSNSLEYHENRSADINDCDSLDYMYDTQCWGHFYENSLDNGVVLNYYCGVQNKEVDNGAHSGSTILPLDLDKDLDKEALIGDISYNNLVAVYNGGTLDSAHMVSYDSLFPSYDTPVDIVFPAAFYLDVDNDNVKDLVVTSNAPGISNNYESVWFYKNNGQTDSLVLHLEQVNLLQNQMIEVGEGAYPTFFDYNADGLKDLVIGNYGYYAQGGVYTSKLSLYQNIGTQNDPVFSFVTDDYASLSSLNAQGLCPTFGDLDGDGDADLILGDYTGKLYYFVNLAGQGNPPNYTLQSSNYAGIDIGDHATPQLYDVNNDQKLDLLIGETSGTINYFENTGSTSAPQFTSSPTNGNLGQIDVSPLCCTGYSVPYMSKDSLGNRVLFVASEYGEISYYENIDGNLNGVFVKTDSIFEVQGRISVTGANILGEAEEELMVGSYLGGVTLLKSSEDLYVKSTENSVQNEFKVYPNPTQNFLIIEGLASYPVNFFLTDLTGRIIQKGVLNKKHHVLDTKMLVSGVYIVEVSDEKNNAKFKIIKP